MKTLWRNNGLSITLFTLFMVFFSGQAVMGWLQENQELEQHQQGSVTFAHYVASNSFIEVTAENWESEFLQMFIYVVFTVFLFQRGSSESKSPDEAEEVDRDPRLSKDKPSAPWPVHAGGMVLKLYESSLALTFFLLFVISSGLHALGGAGQFNEENRLHGAPTVTVLEYLGTSRFWFESFQNWQSEFLAIASMVWLAVYLRQRWSPESKPVHAPHAETGR
jgi:Domain of unknown function (DUF6766)